MSGEGEKSYNWYTENEISSMTGNTLGSGREKKRYPLKEIKGKRNGTGGKSAKTYKKRIGGKKILGSEKVEGVLGLMEGAGKINRGNSFKKRVERKEEGKSRVKGGRLAGRKRTRR